MMPAPIILLCDTREPAPVHPWSKWLPSHVTLERATLDTGDFCLSGLPDGAIVERKTVSDFLGCITSNRERFERELARSRHVGRFCIIIEGSLLDCIGSKGQLSEASLIGTVAAWSRRFCPIVFAGTERHAAELCWRYLAGQITEGQRIVKAVEGKHTMTPADQAIVESRLAELQAAGIHLPHDRRELVRVLVDAVLDHLQTDDSTQWEHVLDSAETLAAGLRADVPIHVPTQNPLADASTNP